MSHDLLEEYKQIMVMDASSKKHFGHNVMASKLLSTFKQMCFDGNLLIGIAVGGETGVQVSSMFPFHLNASLLHGTICSKCTFDEFVSMKLDFKIVNDMDDRM
ncbi:hypothetical protein BCV72DRAFT_246342 [Rhizopus microsporus var. microsporus]|uniref:Uncharacterized protein n=2 Tax=Rhizopus microsporus TaxID=58291 RepID=A0A2G4T8H1_RHIZD|nr:uncharacterized protein RHIMIDRAFT_243404 [Rhizopus microsporus ATCC 52813]ORE00894.1 hypothetical protein BCV72DRAFT_246342 [Rhizopus microsporus var. microsporus]PHZ17318.1 hypothetical protein RHIMIDRAFT_243404 [Rhizopus microsporus ATCC 52813]